MQTENLHIGHYVSGAGHLTLIGWLLLGNIFSSEPPPFEATQVSVVTGAEFEAMIAAQQPPEVVTEVAQPPAPEAPPEQTPPEVVEEPPAPAPEVAEVPPALEEPIGDQAVLVPEIAPEAAPRPVDRVAPEPVAQPEPEATPDPVEQEAVNPDAVGEATPDATTQTAPEEATTEIVTEATEAPAASPRPPGRRPAAPAPQVVEAPEETPQDTPPETTEDADADAIAAAVAEAQQTTDAPTAPSGPPLSAGEKESLRVAVSACWNVGSLSSEALRTTVIVSVAMAPDGRPNVGSIQLEGSSGGSDAAARQAFEAARRAIIRCGSSGYDLPSEKYGQWENIEMTFNPERMAVR